MRVLEMAVKDPQVARILDMGPSTHHFDFQPKNVQDMIQDLDRPFPNARYEAANALCDLGPKAAPAIPRLTRGLDDAENMVRMACIRALGSIGQAASNAVPTLQKLRSNEESMLTTSALDEAIRKIQTSLKQ